MAIPLSIHRHLIKKKRIFLNTVCLLLEQVWFILQVKKDPDQIIKKNNIFFPLYFPFSGFK